MISQGVRSSPLFLFIFCRNLLFFKIFGCHIIMSCMVVQESRGESRSDHATEEETGAPLKRI